MEWAIVLRESDVKKCLIKLKNELYFFSRQGRRLVIWENNLTEQNDRLCSLPLADINIRNGTA